MTDYEQFKLDLKTTTKFKDYYQQLMKHTPSILMDISLRNQNRVAMDLNLTSVKFSNLLPMLKELYNAKS